jgi:Tfp pilus assembly protein PilP
MRNRKIFILLALMLFAVGIPGSAQNAPPEPTKPKPVPFSYDPAGRRDPFKDLLAGKEVRDKKLVGGLSELSLDDVILIGIVEARGKLEAIISLMNGFPATIHEGDAFADGYVLKIEAARVVFRKTKNKGIPLIKPKDIVKEIPPEER